MIDLHTHILPGIDDGSRDVGESAKLIEAEKGDGVTTIVATPHFYAQRISVSRFLERRQGAFDSLKKAEEEKNGIPCILQGAEVYYFPGIGRADQIPMLTIEGTKTLLLEMPFSQWNDEVCRDVEDLIQKQGLRIVLAHTERYVRFQKDKKCWNRIMDMDVLIQLNAESILRKNTLFGPDKGKRFCLDYIRDHDDFLLGSDCHNLTDRKPNLREARDAIRALYGEGKLTSSDLLAKEVIQT
jgi:protein-tyrosine phosphatase